MSKRKKKVPAEHTASREDGRTILCSVKGLSFGKNKVALAITFERSDLEIIDADRLFTGALISAQIIPAKDVEGQKTMFNTKIGFKAAAEVGGIRVSPTGIGVTLKFDKQGIDPKRIEHLTFHNAKLIVSRTGDAKAEKDSAGDDSAELLS